MLEIYTYSILITGVFFTAFGVLVFLRNPKNDATKAFLFFSTAFAMWSYSWFFLLKTPSGDLAQAFLYAKLLDIGATAIPILYLHWVLLVLKKTDRFKQFLIFGYAVTVIFLAFSFLEYYTVGVQPALFFPHWPIPGFLFTAFTFIGYLGLVPYTCYLLVREYYEKIGPDKFRAGYILLGTLLGFGGAATIFPISYGLSSVQPFGIFTMMMSPFVLSYAMLRFRLMDVKIFSTQFFIGVLNVVFVINLLLADSVSKIFFGVFLLIFGVVFSILLLRSFLREIRQREEIQRLAEDLRKANERLKELDKLKNQFLSFATHELRAPLTSIRNFLSLLMEGTYGRLPPAAEEGMQQVFDRATGMAGDIDTYLNISRIEQGKMKYDFATIDFAPVLNETVKAFAGIVREKGLALEYTEIKERLPMKADTAKLREVIENLLNNAIAYTPKGTIAVTTEKKGVFLRVIFQDSGVGMTQEVIRTKLFKLFSTGDDSRKINPKSSGVGLYISKAHVEAHKGKIWAESDGPGKGSRFIVELPLAV